MVHTFPCCLGCMLAKWREMFFQQMWTSKLRVCGQQAPTPNNRKLVWKTKNPAPSGFKELNRKWFHRRLWGSIAHVMSWLVFVVFLNNAGRLKPESRKGWGNGGGHQHWVPSETTCLSVKNQWRFARCDGSKEAVGFFTTIKKGTSTLCFWVMVGLILNRPTSEDDHLQRYQASTLKT